MNTLIYFFTGPVAHWVKYSTVKLIKKEMEGLQLCIVVILGPRYENSPIKNTGTQRICGAMCK